MSSRPALARARRAPAAAARPRPNAARRAQARRAQVRRRRIMAGFAALFVIGLVAFAVAPTVKHAVNELELPLQHEDIIRQQAAAKHLDPALIAAVIDAETKFAPRTSNAGAEGLMQILPSTAEALAKRSGGTAFVPSDLGTPQVNIAYGSYYLRYLIDHYHGREVPAIAAYNAGLTTVDRWMKGHSSLRESDIPYPETRAYVAKVFSARSQYRRQYARQLGLR